VTVDMVINFDKRFLSTKSKYDTEDRSNSC